MCTTIDKKLSVTHPLKLNGTELFINKDMSKINSDDLAALRLKEPVLMEKGWSQVVKYSVASNAMNVQKLKL